MKNVSIIAKVIIYVSILGFSCIFIMGYVSITAADEILTEAAFDRITSINNMKKLQMERFFKEKVADVSALAELQSLKDALNQFNTAYHTDSSGVEFVKSPASKLIFQQISDEYRNYIDANQYYDLFLINPDDGLVYFSTKKESDLGSFLKSEPTHLAELWHKCRKDKLVHISDMAKYQPSGNEPAMFVAQSIRAGNELIGVLAVQISNKAINEYVQMEDGLDKNGETFLVGSDYLYRSDSRSSNQFTILDKAYTEATIASFKAEKSGAIITNDYQNQKVLSSFAKLDIPEISWAIVTEVKEAYIMAPKRDLIYTILYVCIFIGLIMMPILWIIGRSINKPIKKAIEYAKELASGDMTATLDIHQKDETGKLADALREMVTNIKNIISNVTMAADNVSDASFQLSSTSQEISQGASMQASSIEEVSSSIEEMSSNIEYNSDSAQKTEEITTNVSNQIMQGGEIVYSAVEAMEKVAGKISIISDIAFQTNILALNAAVEAARAGEHGKGFGVVASEVGKLAEKTRIAAAEIDEISQNSVQIAEQAKKLMSAMVPDIQKSSNLVREISAASKEQTIASQHINDAVQQLNEVTQQNAAASEEMATSSEELASQAEQLKQIIAYFTIDKIEKGKHPQETNKVTERKYPEYAQKRKSISNPAKMKGIQINMGGNDEYDSEFERF